MKATSVCSVDGCDGAGKLVRGLCHSHYVRSRRGMDLTAPLRRKAPGSLCSVEGCDRVVQSRGMCKMHAKRDRVYGDPNIAKPQHWPRPGLGEEHHLWAGDAITYKSAHSRVRRARGSASGYDCAHCGSQARDWAYDKTDPTPIKGYWRGSLLTYSGNPDRYLPLCRPCHRLFDS